MAFAIWSRPECPLPLWLDRATVAFGQFDVHVGHQIGTLAAGHFHCLHLDRLRQRDLCPMRHRCPSEAQAVPGTSSSRLAAANCSLYSESTLTVAPWRFSAKRTPPVSFAPNTSANEPTAPNAISVPPLRT